MRAWFETVTLSGRTLRVVTREPLPADAATLAVASAIRVLERFPALDQVCLVAGDGEREISRQEVDRLLAPDGYAALQERGRWPQLLARAVQRYTASGEREPA